LSKHDSSNPQDEEVETTGKGRPTPSRKEAQARNAQPLVGDRSKEARRAQRQRVAEQRERARVGMAQGDERYLTARDRGPQRRWVRDWVDARWSMGEFLIPAMLVVLVSTFLPGRLPYYGIAVMWVFVALTAVDLVFMCFRLGRKLREKFGSDNRQSGWRWYACMRAMQFRPLRLPKPQVKRGSRPE
jgi:hypothetical protein